MFTIATWNVNSIRVRLAHILQWLEQAQPDVLAIQETKVEDKAFPEAELAAAGYHVAFCGQRTYNGVALLSREPMEDIAVSIDGVDAEQKRTLGATIHGIRIWNLYVPNGSSVDSDKYQYKLEWLAGLATHVEKTLPQQDKMILLGDFNIAPEDRDVHNPEAWEGNVLVSEPERTALKRLLDAGLNDSFRLFEQGDKLYSWWDYRQLAFRRNRGLRIDHILASAPLAKHCTQCWIDKEPRKWERPSDHAPVIAEFDL